MTNTIERILATSIDWQRTEEDPFIFRSSVDGRNIRLRLNDFPEEPLCTVILDNVETDLHEFPKLWRLPRHRGEQ
jgi:hypothetical protein